MSVRGGSVCHTGGASTRRGEGAAALLLAAAVYHPIEQDRKFIRQTAERWLRNLKPRIGQVEALEILASETGTVINPFDLNERDREFAGLCVRAWSSEKFDLPSIRIVGRDSLTSAGGLVIRRDGTTDYIDRFAYATGERDSQHANFVAPNLIDQSSFCCQTALQAESLTLRVESPGARIELVSGSSSPLQLQALRSMQDTGRVLGRHLSFGEIGLRVEQYPDRLELLTGSAESWIRLVALCEERAQLRFEAPIDENTKAIWLVRLQPAREQHVKLPALRVEITNGDFSWANLGLPSIRPGLRCCEAVARWTRPHATWLPMITRKLDETDTRS